MKPLIHSKLWFLIVSLVFSVSLARAQQDPLFTHYLYNRVLVNPAYAGSNYQLVATTLYRTQWLDIDGAPDTYTVHAHGSFLGNNVGLGLSYQQDMIGPTVSKDVTTHYAYHLNMNRRKLSFGLSFGYKNISMDWDKLNFYDPNEPALFDPPGSAWKPTFNVGVYYQGPTFYVGLSSKELLQSEYFSVDNNGNRTTHSLHQHLYLMGGYIFANQEKQMAIRPSALVKWVKNAPLEVDVNLMAFLSPRFGVGASYRTTHAISGLVHFGILRNLIFGYSYDYYFNALECVNTGSHEVMLRVEFEFFNEKLKTPRFF